jgi:CelD/BcsL family acetyltransferase involved in cellulose biosynthesis
MTGSPELTIVPIGFGRLAEIRSQAGDRLRWPAVFDLPAWLESWWSCLAGRAERLVLAVMDGREVIGVAPLMAEGSSAAFIGDPDLCDHHDFIVAPGREPAFFSALLAELDRRGLDRLDLFGLRPDSPALTHLPGLARRMDLAAALEKVGVSLESDLPGDWEGYLAGLTSKQRHEIRRKMRRLGNAGRVGFDRAHTPDQAGPALEIFLDLFRRSRADKEEFLTPDREAFFRTLVPAMARAGNLSLFTLSLDSRPVASALCFDHRGIRHLYNNGYDSDYKALSLGTLVKVLSLKEAVESGFKVYDFLNGAEPYKHRLGGRERELLRYTIILKEPGELKENDLGR